MRNKSKNSKINKTHLITILLFLAVLYLPTLIFPLVKDKIGQDTSENRALASAPELRIDKIASYPKDFDKFYNDNLPFRAPIRKAWNYLNVFGLRSSTSNKVLFGKDTRKVEDMWMFYKSAAEKNPVRIAQGYGRYTDDRLSELKEKVQLATEWFNERGIEYYALIAPNKENIYKELLPEDVSISSNESKIDVFAAYMLENGVNNLIYPKQELLDGKNIAPTYYKQDTHWNEWGGFIGFSKYMQHAKPNIDTGNVDVEVVREKKNEDLARMIGFEGITYEDVPYVNYLKDIEYNTEVIETKEDSITVTLNSSAPIRETVMIVGDSFRVAMIDYFAKTYEKCIFMHRKDYEPEMLEQYNPDVFISEKVERYTEIVSDWVPD